LRDLADSTDAARVPRAVGGAPGAGGGAGERGAPGTIEPADALIADTIARVELPTQENEDDLAQVSAMIDEAGARAEGAAKAISGADKPASDDGSDGSSS